MSAREPWDAIRREQDARARRLQEQEDAEAARKKIAAMWVTAAERLDALSLVGLVESLRNTDFGLWLDQKDVWLARQDWIHDQNLWPGYVRGPGFYYCIAGLKLLKHALLSSEQDLQRELDAMHETNSELALADTLRDMRGAFEGWCAGEYPPTPLLSQTELADALRGRLTGYGKSGISTKLKSEELQILSRSSAARDGKTFYASFRHRDRDVQRAILVHIVRWAREKSPPHCSFFDGLWSPDPDKNGA